MPYEIKELAGAPYIPSNGTEGDIFRHNYCERCAWWVPEFGCPIELSTYRYEPDDPGYPSQWTHTPEGEPTCLVFTTEIYSTMGERRVAQ